MKANTVFDDGGLSPNEKTVIDSTVQSLGYKDLHHFVTYNGCASAPEFVQDFHFTSVRDFFIGDGWYSRVAHLRRNGNGSGEKLASAHSR